MQEGAEIKVKIGKGLISGYYSDGIDKFLGIPYATQERFKRSKPIEKYEGKVDATGFGHDPFQFDDCSRDGLVPNQDENCLFLNIWKPHALKKIPVLVYIYGGGFTTGTSSFSMYGGSNLAKRGLLFVSFNYRLGLFGFSSFEEYGQGFESNCALSDQINALKWIKSFISNFGGDPENITIFGESAGGASVLNLLASPSSHGLFSKLICNSGLPHGTISKSESQRISGFYATEMGVKKNEGEKLKNLKADDLVKKCREISGSPQVAHMGMPSFRPCIDDLLPYDSVEAVKNGSLKDWPVKIIIGTNKDEGTIFARPGSSFVPFDDASLKRYLDLNGKSELYEPIVKYYSQFEGKMFYQELAKDLMFRIGSIEFANLCAKEGINIHVFEFQYSTPYAKKVGMRCCHFMETPLELDNIEAVRMRYFYAGTKEMELKAIRNRLVQPLLGFVKTGNPEEGLPYPWPAYSLKKQVVAIDLKTSLMSYENMEVLKLFQIK